MKKSLASLIALTATVLALSTVAAPEARAQEQAQVILTAQASAEPFAFAFVDANGQTGSNAELAKTMKTHFAGSQWSITNNGQLTVSKGGQALIQALYVANEKKTWFLLHRKTAQSSVDGTIWRFSDDPNKGAAELFLTLVGQDGKTTATVFVAVDLQFSTPGGGGGNTGGFGGFGGFGG